MIYDMIYICSLQLGWHPVAVVQYTSTQQQYIQGVIKKFRDLVSENYNLLLIAKNIQ